MSKTFRISADSGFEVDAFEHRRDLRCFRGAGVARKAKRAFNRRARRAARFDILCGLEG